MNVLVRKHQKSKQNHLQSLKEKIHIKEKNRFVKVNRNSLLLMIIRKLKLNINKILIIESKIYYLMR